MPPSQTCLCSEGFVASKCLLTEEEKMFLLNLWVGSYLHHRELWKLDRAKFTLKDYSLAVLESQFLRFRPTPPVILSVASDYQVLFLPPHRKFRAYCTICGGCTMRRFSLQQKVVYLCSAVQCNFLYFTEKLI